MFKYDKDMKEIIIYRGPQQKIKGDTFSLDLVVWTLCEPEEGTLTKIKFKNVSGESTARKLDALSF